MTLGLFPLVTTKQLKREIIASKAESTPSPSRIGFRTLPTC
jgi:hypothetical protein